MSTEELAEMKRLLVSGALKIPGFKLVSDDALDAVRAQARREGIEAALHTINMSGPYRPTEVYAEIRNAVERLLATPSEHANDSKVSECYTIPTLPTDPEAEGRMGKLLAEKRKNSPAPTCVTCGNPATCPRCGWHR